MELMTNLIVLFFALSLLLYLIFGGADLGAGILELFLSKETREEERALITHAMAPVWEANHVWLILAVVILFMGFPTVYTEISTYLHLPLMAILVGIVARGCAFTFRYYDTSRTYRRTYTRVFAYSSLWTAFFLGVCGSALQAGYIDPSAQDYATLFVDPWLNPYCLSQGLLAACLFTTLAAVFLVGEAENVELTRIMRRKAKVCLIVLALAAPLPFLAGFDVDLPLLKAVLTERLSLISFILALLAWPALWISLNSSIWTTRARILMVLMATSMVTAWFSAQYPMILNYHPDSNQADLTFAMAAAPEPTLRVLLGGLIIGSLLIFPALAYLFKVFKWETLDEERRYR